MADRFYTSDPLDIGDYELKGSEAHHLTAVRRFGPGDRVVLFNGNGSEYPAEVISVGKKNAHLNITAIQSTSQELVFPLVVCSALPKGDRADFLIEKLTELGAVRFIPLIADRSIVRPKEAVVEKYRRAVIEASKQCGRNTLMTVEPPSTWTDLLKRLDLPRLRYLLHADSTRIPIEKPMQGVMVAIGPEGGFTQEEIETAKGTSWKILCLGPRILRVETAALAATALLSVG